MSSLECSFLQGESPLTDTTNKILLEAESSCARKYFTDTSSLKRPWTSLRSEHLTVNKYLTEPDVKNTFVKTEAFRKVLRCSERSAKVTICRKPPDYGFPCMMMKKKIELGLLLESLDDRAESIALPISSKKCKNVQDTAARRFYSYSGQNQFSSTIQEQQQQLHQASAPLELHSYSFGAARGDLGSASPCYDVMPHSRTNVIPVPMIRKYPVTLDKMPVYYFESLPFKQTTVSSYKSLEEDSQLSLKNLLRDKKIIKMRLLNAVSTSLLCSPKFKETDDAFRDYMLNCMENVVSFDPEFILKIAMYARLELNIRSTSNFLLAFAAKENKCRPFLKKYFEYSIVLPTDWISVAEMYLVFNPDMQTKSLPAALRKVMKSAFSKFDAYQLAKYNKQGKGIKKKKMALKQAKKQAASSDDEMEKTKTGCFTLKQLIRLLHITSPVEHVMPILGKKYPSDLESFREAGLPGIWDSANAGKRMKLPEPETWEVSVSSLGNKAFVWESLIDKSKLPYMATLRNLRNLLLSGISSAHHGKVQSHLSAQHAVIKSRQFPLRFYAAYKVLEELETICQKVTTGSDILRSKSDEEHWKRKRKELMEKKVHDVDLNELEKYKQAISTALEISANHNLEPIGGRTLVICDLTDNFSKTTGEAANFSKKRFHSCILLSLMCLKACEECEIKAILPDGTFESIELKNKLFLENLSELCSKYEDTNYSSACDEEEMLLNVQLQVEHYLKPQTFLHQKLDNVIYLQSRDLLDSDEPVKSNFLHKYRHLVNPNLLFIQVDLSVDSQRSGDFLETSDENNVYLTGFSEQIFKFIAARSNGGQLAYVENIDTKFNLMKKEGITYSEDFVPDSLCTFGQKIPIYSGVPKWKTVRIFVSSTFKDMHGERDVLLRYVFPELKARAASLFVKINEIDLRWGISEADASSSRSHQLCLLEAQNCDFFIGILGERYGTRFRFDGDVDPRLDWVKEHKDASITELEMMCGALNRESSRERAFFFFRNNAFLREVPPDCRKYFQAEDPESGERLSTLKNKIRQSGMEILEWYPCHFAGLYDENPVVAGLDVFGQTVLNNLWNAVKKFYKKDDDATESPGEETWQEMLTSSYSNYIGEQNSPLSWVTKELKKNSGIFVVTGRPGCGKTAFIIRLLKEIKSGLVIPYFVGVSPQSADLSYMLCYIGNSVLSKLPLDISVPNTKEGLLHTFPDIITEGSKASFPGTLLVVIDGLDYLDTESQTLDWLPYDLPQNFKLICSASDSSRAYKSLSKRRENDSPIYFVPMKPLVVADRQQFVRQNLKQHGKSLDESPFNNQMIQLVTKADSSNPLYLQVACDYLKTFAVFENLMQKLQTFPSMLNGVLEEIIIQMEKLHGSSIVQNALTMMSIVREGLEDNDMHILLSVLDREFPKDSPGLFDKFVSKITCLKLEEMVQPVSFRSLVHMLKTFAYPFANLSHGGLRLASKEFASVVAKYYLKKEYGLRLPCFHKLIAAYYFTICNPKHNENWKVTSYTAFSGLLYHLLWGNNFAKLEEFLCCVNFIHGAFDADAGEELPEYYEALLNSAIIAVPGSKDKIQDYRNFVDRNMHVLKSWPFLIYQQALNEPFDSCVFKANAVSKQLALECLTRSSETLMCYPKTLDGFVKGMKCVKFAELSPIAALGNEDGSAKILEVSTGKIISSLRGHSLTITSVCFLGKDRICLASADNTLSIWSCSNHYRIAVLEGHTRFISSCCCDPQGNIVSSAWDCTVRFWSSQDGRMISCIDKIKCPVNSVAHHPEQQIVACGLWNKTIEIWDASYLTRKSVLHGHSASVQSVVYNASGLHLLSSSLSLEVFIWSTDTCLKVAKLDGHTSFVNSICCSSKGFNIVTASEDTTLKVWSDEQQSVQLKIKEFKNYPVHSMEIVSQLLLAVVFQNSTIRVFDLVDGHVVAVVDTVSDPVSCLSKFSGGKVVGQQNYKDRSVEVLIFGTKSGKAMELKFENSSVAKVGFLNSRITAMLHTECLIFCGTSNGDVAVLSFDNNVPHGILCAAHENSVSALSASSSRMNGYILSVSADETIKLWEFGDMDGKKGLTPRLEETYQSKHKDHLTSCCLYRKSISKEAKSVMVTGSYDNSVVIWDNEKEQFLTGLKTSVLRVCYAGKYIVGCGSEGSILVWTQKGKCVSNIPGIEMSSAVIAFDFQTDKKSITDFDATLAFVENDGSIIIRKPFQRSSFCTLQGHGHSVTSCDINKDDVVLSSSSDKTVNIWKLPKSVISDSKVYHSGKIKAVAISHSSDLAFSGDEYGNLILWQISIEEGKFPLKYIAQKKYVNGSVTAVLWMEKDRVVCAGQMQEKSKDKHFIEILTCKPSSELESSFIIQVQQQKFFESEITSLDCHPSTGSLAVGLKSGNVFVMTPGMENEVKVASDWIVQVKLSMARNPYLFIVETDGVIKMLSFSALCINQAECRKTVDLFKNDKSWITALTCDTRGTIFAGDTSGQITSYNESSTITKQAHVASISAICIAGCYVFTCSLDRTLKVWNSADLEQIGQFHSQCPISCLAVPEYMRNTSDLKSQLLIFGTITGDVHIIRFTNPLPPNSNMVGSVIPTHQSSINRATLFAGVSFPPAVSQEASDNNVGFGEVSAPLLLGSQGAANSSTMFGGVNVLPSFGSQSATNSSTVFGGRNIPPPNMQAF